MNNIISILIDNKDLGYRIDLLIKKKNSQLSRTQLQKLIKKGNVTFNNEIIPDSSFKIKNKGEIIIRIPKIQKLKIEAQNIKLDIISENKNLIVLNKPAGMVIHPGAGNHKNTLVNALLYHCRGTLSGIGGVERPGIIHRLDKMTSGIVVIAKNDITHQKISSQFKNRLIEKKYEAFVWNKLKKKAGKIKINIKRSSTNRKKMAVTTDNTGKIAVTEYELIKEYEISKNIFVSWITVKILTGRTHQIRVHMSEIGNNLVGDQVYKVKNLSLKGESFYKPGNVVYDLEKTGRQALHAKELSFFDPFTQKVLKYKACLPNDLKRLKIFLKNF